MIKRMAHRNANVQLYTLEVRGSFSAHFEAQWNVWDVSLTGIF